MSSIVISTIVFFVVRHYVNRYLDEIGVPKSFTRGTVAFCAALLAAYIVAYGVDRLVS